MRAFRGAVCLGLMAWITGSAPSAAEIGREVDLALVLAVDVSGSIDADEARLQRQGYVAAITDPEVIGAIRAGIHRRIAVTYVEWHDSGLHRVLIDWTEIADAASAKAFAERLAEQPINIGRRTSISGAIEVGIELLRVPGVQPLRRVIDISGDGANNDGGPVDQARDHAVKAGITINGLPILNDRPNRFGFPNQADLDKYYEGCVIGGPGAFIVVAQSFETFAVAIRRKLILEIADSGGIRHDAQFVPPDYAPGCDIGERMSQEFYRRRFAPD